MQTAAEREQQAEQNRKRLLQAEAAALLLLLRRRDHAVRQGVAAGLQLGSIAARIQQTLASGIAEARSISRTAGAVQLRAELAATVRGDVLLGSAADPSQIARDIHRAREYGTSYARRWLRKATEAQSTSTQAASASASADTLGSLRRTAVTESAEAYNGGRGQAAQRLPALGLLRVWDAVLDKGTCPICSQADGTIVGLKERFPLGEPGTIHAFCRCTWTLLQAREDARGTLIEPAPVQPVRTDPLKAPLPAKAAPLQRVMSGINERELVFLREGYRAPLSIYEGVAPSDVNAVATGRMLPPGSSRPVPPITISSEPGGILVLTDGRHRLEAAQKAGATEMLARLRVYGPRGGVRWEGERIIPTPRIDPLNPHGRQ